jgi:hypothetical protein
MELADLLRQETERRDELVRKLSAAGFTRREVAVAARLSAGRVQQIASAEPPAGRTLADRIIPATSRARERSRAERMEALARANDIGSRRAQLKRQLAEGRVSAAEVILACPPEAHTWSIGDLLLSIRRWGHTRCRNFLVRNQINEEKALGKLTERQRWSLAAQLEAAGAPRRDRHPGALDAT